MNYLIGIIILLIGFGALLIHARRGQGYTGDNLLAVARELSYDVYRPEESIPDNYNVPVSQTPRGISFGSGKCIKCEHDTGNCSWVVPCKRGRYETE